MSTVETHAFQAEVQQVLRLVVHSLYSHKEIFLRELISNASDACDKLRFESLAHPDWMSSDSELRIELEVDPDARLLRIRDNGIGMSRDEAIDNLGTIARSGTARFLEAMAAEKRGETALIGQFGVGFYAAFMVADQVSVSTRRADLDDSAGVRWVSDGQGGFTIESVAGLPRGTTIELVLREDEREFLEIWRLENLIRQYSDHIAFPIRVLKTAPAAEGESAPEPSWHTINQAQALWTRAKADISEDEYKAFYQHLSHDFGEPMAWSHNRVEGKQSFTTLLYVPAQRGFDQLYGRDERKGLKLYVKRVFILDAAEQLLPNWLRFARGIVDSDDLPLNVSRELLQDNRLVSQIRAACTKRILDMLDKQAEDHAENYQNFFNEFGQVLKEGIVDDATHRERIAKLLRFSSTAADSKERSVSLDQYIARMPAEQDAIWYVTAESLAAAKGSPQIEALVARGVEVLLLHDRVDEWMIGHLREFQGKTLRHAAKGELDLAKLPPVAGQETPPEESSEADQAVLSSVQTLLAERVREVRASTRLIDSPSCLVLDGHDMALHLQRLLKDSGHPVHASKPALELNLSHPLVRRLADSDQASLRADLAELLYEQAVLAEGGALDDPPAFLKRLNRILVG